MTRHEVWFKETIDSEWAKLAYTGLWNDPFKEDLDAFIEKTQERVSGTVRLKLYKGTAQVVGRSSPLSLYDIDLATYNASSTFNQAWAEGFIQVWGMPTVVANIRSRQNRDRILKRTIQPEAPLP